MTNGKQALGRVLEHLAAASHRIRSDTNIEEFVDEVWPDFRAAVLEVLNEADAEKAEGVRRWQEARHEDTAR